jgi:hypothetical protein
MNMANGSNRKVRDCSVCREPAPPTTLDSFELLLLADRGRRQVKMVGQGPPLCCYVLLHDIAGEMADSVLLLKKQS